MRDVGVDHRPPVVTALPAAGTEGRVLRQGNHIWYDNGTSWIQVDNAAGGSALDANNNQLIPTATANTTPSTGIAMQARQESGRSFPAFVNVAGEVQAIQESLVRGGVQLVEATTNTAILTTLNTTLTMAGSSAAVSPATGSYGASRAQVKYASTATAATLASNYEAGRAKWRGNAAGRGGFLCAFTFVPALLAGHAFFTGLSANSTTTMPTSTIGSTHVGLLVEAADSVFSFTARDGTTTTKTTTGLASTSTACLTLTLWCPPNASYIWARLVNEDTGALVAESQLTATLPSTATFLGFSFVVGNGAVASVAAANLIRLYSKIN